MLWKIFSIIARLFSITNMLYCMLFTICFILIIIIFLQKNSEDFSENKNLFGPNVRAEVPIKITYAFITLFVFFIIFINFSLQRDYRNNALVNTFDKINKEDKPELRKKNSNNHYRIRRRIIWLELKKK